MFKDSPHPRLEETLDRAKGYIFESKKLEIKPKESIICAPDEEIQKRLEDLEIIDIVEKFRQYQPNEYFDETTSIKSKRQTEYFMAGPTDYAFFRRKV